MDHAGVCQGGRTERHHASGGGGVRKKLTEADLWDSEESARRGFACPREWKERLTAREYERIKAISRKWLTGDDRQDVGLVKAAVFIASSMAKLNGFDTDKLFPNPPPKREMTLKEQFDAFFKISQNHNAKWQPSQSAP